MSDSPAVLEPDALFVIACPVCLGQVAATGSLCGRDACCPLCASLFQVPFPQLAARPVPSPPPVPPSPPPVPPSPGLAEDWGRVIRQLAPPPREQEPEHAIPPASPSPAVFELAEPPVEPASSAAHVTADDQVAPAADGLPMVGGTPLDPAATELVFSEPVRTVRHGATVIEIRRLTPEERRARRFRRNLLMVAVGVSILLAIVLVFGVPKKP